MYLVAVYVLDSLTCYVCRRINLGARSFRVAAPTVWKSLPADIRARTFYGSFIRQLKTYFINVFSMLLASGCPRLRFNVLSIDFVRVTNYLYDYDYNSNMPVTTTEK